MFFYNLTMSVHESVTRNENRNSLKMAVHKTLAVYLLISVMNTFDF